MCVLRERTLCVNVANGCACGDECADECLMKGEWRGGGLQRQSEAHAC